MFASLEEIKQAVEDGRFVCLTDSTYQVIKENGKYLIKCHDNEDRLELTHQDGITLRFELEDFGEVLWEIRDWANNLKFDGKQFHSFDEGVSHLYEYANSLNLSEKDHEEYLGEFHVIEVEKDD